MKTLLITGASSEIGTALIETIIGNYDLILAHYRTKNEKTNQLTEKYGKKIIWIYADFLSVKETENFISQIEKLGIIPDDIVHLPAPKYLLGKFHMTEWEVYQQNIDISIRSIVLILKHFIHQMAHRKKGKVIFMLSSCTIGIPPKYTAYYTATKYALLGLMKELSSEYADQGICINAISPDMIETKFLSELPRMAVLSNAKKNPQNQNLKPKDLMEIFCRLLLDEESINGKNIKISLNKEGV